MFLPLTGFICYVQQLFCPAVAINLTREYCSDTRYEEKLQEKGAQHKALEEALKDYGYNVTALPIIIGQSGSQYHTTSDAPAKIGVEHGPANKIMSKLHKHSVLTFHKILTSRRVLEREKTDKRRQNRPGPS